MPTPEAEGSDVLRLAIEALGKGSVASAEVMRRAADLGLSEPTVRRAKKRLGVVAERRNAQAPWYWRLPTLEEAAPDGQVTVTTA
jgi:hypothetical protein